MKHFPHIAMLALVLLGCGGTAPNPKPAPATQPVATIELVKVVEATPQVESPAQAQPGDSTTILTPGGKTLTTPGGNRIIIHERITGQIAAATQQADSLGGTFKAPAGEKLDLTNSAAAKAELKGINLQPPKASETQPGSVGTGGSNATTDTASQFHLTVPEQTPQQWGLYLIGVGLIVAGCVLAYLGIIPWGGGIGMAALGILVIGIGAALSISPWLMIIPAVIVLGVVAYIAYRAYGHKVTATAATAQAATAQKSADVNHAAVVSLLAPIEDHQMTGDPINLSGIPPAIISTITNAASFAGARIDTQRPDPVETASVVPTPPVAPVYNIQSATIHQPASPVDITTPATK